nr:tripartite tricarboxylate transporter permease [Pasteurella multocida]
MFDQIIAGFNEFFTWGSFLYINLGLFLGIVFGSIPGLTVMLCLVLFLPITYSLNAIHSFMFLLGIYCAGNYGGIHFCDSHQNPRYPTRCRHHVRW